MTHCSHSTRRLSLAAWLFATALVFLVSCSKPQPSAPTQDFARRHNCPIKEVESNKEPSGKMRVTGCDTSEVYVLACANSQAEYPENEVRMPVTEAEAKYNPPRRSAFVQGGCAWTREQRTSAGSQQPQWLSSP